MLLNGQAKEKKNLLLTKGNDQCCRYTLTGKKKERKEGKRTTPYVT